MKSGMLDNNFFADIRQQHAAFVAARREVIKVAGDAQNASKRAIFALHRDDVTEAESLLKKAREGLGEVLRLAETTPAVTHEGSYRAALEEFVEAMLYFGFVKDGTVGKVDGIGVPFDVYLGGLSDLTGELQRRQVRYATDGDLDEVRSLAEAIRTIVEELVSYDLGGYLRTKFDQAKNSARRAEDVLYEVSIRRA